MKYIIYNKTYICSDVTSEMYGKPVVVHKRLQRIVANILICCSFIFCTNSMDGYINTVHNSLIKKLEKQYVPPFSKEELITQINKINPSYQKLCLAQCQYESGMGTSVLFKKTNNLFGITVFKISEPHYDIMTDGVTYHFKVYDNWIESLKDWYKLVSHYQDKALIQYMGNYYCKDVGYVQKLNNIYNTK